jgi:hypothetical protein
MLLTQNSSQKAPLEDAVSATTTKNSKLAPNLVQISLK